VQGVMCEAGRMPRGERLKLRSSSDYGCIICPMSLDTRDYWKEKWNKRSGYSERSDFRVSYETYRKKRSFSFWHFFELLGLILCVPVALIYLAKYFL